MPDGRVLVAGGFDFAKNLAHKSSDLIDPESSAVAPGPALATGRNFGAAVALGDGALVVLGGFHPRLGSLQDVELLAAGAGAFTVGKSAMTEAREAHTATLLEDGRVLVAGGLDAQGFRFRASADAYDPSTGRFAKTGAMTAPRAFHAAVRLASGDVLVVGGDSGKGELANAERFDVMVGGFARTKGERAVAGKAVAAALLPDGRVLVAGGANAKDGAVVNADVYDAASDSFVPVPPMATPRMAHTLTALADGRVLAVGGWSNGVATDAVEIFDPGTSAWETLPLRLARGRLDHVAIPLGRCRVLIAGGQHAATGTSPTAPLEIELVTLPPRPR